MGAAEGAAAEWERALTGWQRVWEMEWKKPTVPVGLSPKEVIWSRNKAKLYRYRPMAERRHRVPVLLVYALINKPYVMDLYPGRSMVEGLLKEGFDVYLLDWGTAGPEDRHMKFDDYVVDYLPAAVRKVLRHAGTDQLSMLGYCIGGTLSALYAALHPDGPLRNLVLLAAPIDFTDADLFSVWTSALDVDRMVDVWGNIPPEAIDFGSKLLKPISNWVRSYQALAEQGHDETFRRHWMALNQWVNDGTPFPGEAYRQWIKEFYRENRLTRGELSLGGRRVDLSQIKANLLTIAATHDHICQPCQATPINDLVSSTDQEVFIVKAGHVGITTGGTGPRVLYPKLAQWLGERSGIGN